jgi:transcription elongation GreA/GreB family factor
LSVSVKPQEPAIGDIDLDLAHQLAFGSDAEQVADEQRLEYHRRIERRAAVVGAVKRRGQIVDEAKVDRRVDLAKQVIR